MRASAKILWAIALLSVASAASALEAKSGRIKIKVSETNARLSVYYLSDPAKNAYIPLLYDQDPRTTFMNLYVDSRQYKLGDSPDFRFAISALPDGIKVEFKSPLCVVVEKIQFIASTGASSADGVAISIAIENVSDRDMSLGLRYLFDTYLGEGTAAHFRTDARDRINEETGILANAADRYILSDNGKSAMMLMLRGTGVTTPDSAQLANWKRLTDAAWSVDLSATRNFTLLPYSINDSAIALLYNPQVVPRGTARNIVIALGAFAKSGFATSSATGLSATASTGYPSVSTTATTAPTTSATTPVLPTVSATPSASAARVAAVQADIATLRDLIARIEAKIRAGVPVTDAELAELRALLDALEKKKASY